MAESTGFDPVRRSSDRIAVAAQVNEPSADAQASRPRPAGALLRPSQVPVPSATTTLTGFPSPAGEQPHHGLKALRPNGASTGAALVPVRPSTIPARPVPDLLPGSGQPLAAPVKEEMDARPRADFSQDRVHTGSIARAIQRRQGPVARTLRGSGLKVSERSHRDEQAAEANDPLSLGSRGQRKTTAGAELPGSLQAGIEALSGVALDDVRVHYGSARPAALGARAYTEAPRIFLGPGQQAHLPHEAWHVVQQRQGRVRPLRGESGHPVNDDPVLEREATAMGARAAAVVPSAVAVPVAAGIDPTTAVAQLSIPGLEDIKNAGDVPDEWVDRYLDDMVHPEAHLDHGDLVAYLDMLDPTWHTNAYLINETGDHWDVMLIAPDGTEHRIDTLPNGSCGVYAVLAIRHRATMFAEQEFPTKPVGAGVKPERVVKVRNDMRAHIQGNREEIQRRILVEIHRNDFLELTGFGPGLQEALSKRILATSPTVSGNSGLTAPHSRPTLMKPEGAQPKEIREKENNELQVFMAKHQYTKSPSYYFHELFEHATVTLYPKERNPPTRDEQQIKRNEGVPREGEQKTKTDQSTGKSMVKKSAKGSGKAEQLPQLTTEKKQENPPKGETTSMRTRVHRPILDLEVVDGRFYVRCYLSLFRKATGSSHKDITADDTGTITIKSDLMNLSNPFKALLWCEDYLSSNEHTQSNVAPDPVIRSFLVPLANADWLLSGGGRPLDQDRGSGQFGHYNDKSVYADNLKPLAGSLVSFFLNVEELKKEANQTKLPMTLIQQYLTGHPGDPREMAPDGLAAQHNRKSITAKFADGYNAALTAYYESLRDTGFTDATQSEGDVKTGRYKKNRAEDLLSVDLSKYPHVIAEAKRHPKPDQKKTKDETQ